MLPPKCIVAAVLWASLAVTFSVADEDSPALVQQADLDSQRDVYDADIPWEGFLTPAPSVVALLGQLTVMANKESVDFPLNEHTPEGGFKYIRYPNSFRASLSAFIHDAWNAFHGAYNAMNTIQIRMMRIPRLITSVMSSVVHAPAQIMLSQARIDLYAMKNIGNECLNKARGTHHTFWTVINTTAELISSTTSSRSVYETKMQRAKIELAISLDQQRFLNQTYDENKASRDKAQAEIDARTKSYDDALNSIPDGWGAIGQDLVATVAEGVGNVIRCTTTLLLQCGGKGKDTVGTNTNSKKKAILLSASSAARFLDKLRQVRTSILEVFQPDFSGNARQLMQEHTDGLEVMKTFLTHVPNHSTLLSGMTSAGEICSEVGSVRGGFGIRGNESAGNESESTSKENKYVGRLESLIERMEALTITLSTQQETVPESPQQEFTGHHADAKWKASMNHKLLLHQRQNQQLLLNQSMQLQQQMLDLMGRIARVNMETVSYKEILEFMREAIDILSAVRAQWAKLVEFFANVATRVELVVDDILKPYQLKLLDALQYKDENIRPYLVRRIRDNSQDLLKASYYLHIISGMYVDVHTKHISGPLAGMDRLASLQGQEQTNALQLLQRDVTQAQESIRELVQTKRQEYVDNLQSRLDTSQAELDALGKLSPVQEYAMKASLAGAALKKAYKPANPFLV